MNIAICGGGLQGLELAYLAQLLNWPTTILDRNKMAAAKELATNFINLDLVTLQQCDHYLSQADLVIPACENDETLKLLSFWAESRNKKVAFNWSAYQISSNKKLSKELFLKNNIPTALDWPNGQYPYIAKPCIGSGSQGVKIINNELDLKNFWDDFKKNKKDWLIEEYNPGEAYSIEITGNPNNYTSWDITSLFFDDKYDCKRVTAPAKLDLKLKKQLASIATDLAQSLQLSGLMDVEVILSPTGFKVLEIDARFPSQTPSTVYWSSGVNLLAVLANCFGFSHPVNLFNKKKSVIYEHVSVKNKIINHFGENIISKGGPLKRYPSLWGATEVLTNYENKSLSPSSSSWVATLIIVADDEKKAEKQYQDVINNIKQI